MTRLDTLLTTHRDAWSNGRIAADANCSIDTVRRRRAALGIPTYRGRGWETRADTVDWGAVDWSLPDADIAEAAECSISTVRTERHRRGHTRWRRRLWTPEEDAAALRGEHVAGRSRGACWERAWVLRRRAACTK